MDQPVPLLTEQETTDLVNRHYRWNLSMCAIDGGVFWLGMSFVSAFTIVPLFISKLTPSIVPLGIAAMLAQGGWFLPQLFTANWVERMPRRKPVVVKLGFVLERLPFAMFLVAALLAGRWPLAALIAFLLGYMWNRLGAGVIATAWQDLLGRVLPVALRGRSWGLISALGTACGFIASLLSAWLLKTLVFPTNFVVIFGIAAILPVLGWLSLSQIREVPQPVRQEQPRMAEFFAQLPHLLEQDQAFRRFLVARMLLGLGAMGMGFVTAAAIQKWAIQDAVVGLDTGVQLVGQVIGTIIFGSLADRHGHKLSIEWGAASYALAFLIAWLAPGPVWFHVVFFLLGLGRGILLVSGIMVLLEFCQPARRPTYVGIANTGVGLATMSGPLIGLWLARVDYDLLFAVSSALCFVSLGALHWWVKEPRWAAQDGAETPNACVP